MRIEWNSEYVLGIKDVDEQHRQFIDLINQTYALAETNHSNREIKELLELILTHAKAHFALEEALFDKHHYQHAQEHKNQHQELTDQIMDFKKQLKRDGVKLTMSFLGFLVVWLTEHMNVHDRKYARFLRKQGVR